MYSSTKPLSLLSLCFKQNRDLQCRMRALHLQTDSFKVSVFDYKFNITFFDSLKFRQLHNFSKCHKMSWCVRWDKFKIKERRHDQRIHIIFVKPLSFWLVFLRMRSVNISLVITQVKNPFCPRLWSLVRPFFVIVRHAMLSNVCCKKGCVTTQRTATQESSKNG